MTNLKLKVGWYLTDVIAILIVVLTLSAMFTTIGLGSFWGYIDELIALSGVVVIVLSMLQRKYEKTDLIIIYLSALLLIIGIAGNIIFKYRTDVRLIGLDIIATYKGIVYYLAFRGLRFTKEQIESIVKSTFSLFFVLLVIMFPCACLNLFINFGMGGEIVYGIRSFTFLFSGAGNCSLIFYVIVTGALVKVSLQKCFYRSDKLYLFFALFLWATTLRSRALAYVGIFIILSAWVFYFSKKKKFKIKLWQIILLAIVIYLIAYDKIEYYFQNDQTARYNLLYYGFVTLFNCFPFGSGFATYGSAVASEYYSPLYWQYGFDSIWGLAPGSDSFSNDGLWGEVLGQFGLFGTIVFCVIFGVIFIRLYKSSQDNYDKFLFIYVGLILLLGSIGTKTVMHFTIVPVFILFAIKNRLIDQIYMCNEVVRTDMRLKHKSATIVSNNIN